MQRKLDLRTGTPGLAGLSRARRPDQALTRDVKADVLIVGMGISGAMMAEALAADGMSVIAIDRRGPIKGSTAATTALVQFEIDQPLTLLVGKIGKDRAERAWRRSRLALSSTSRRALPNSASRAADAERNSLYLAGNVLDAGALARGRRARGAQPACTRSI